MVALTGEDFLAVHLWDPAAEPYPLPAAVWHNTVASTSNRHLQQLQQFQQTLREQPHLQRLRLPHALLSFLDIKAQVGRVKWLPQTYFRELTSLHGAFSNLPKYAHNVQAPIDLDQSSTWRNAKEAWSRLAIQNQPVNQAAASCEDITTAISHSSDPEIRAFLMLLWLTCARKGDVARLLWGDVSVEPSGRLKVFVQQGKGVLARQGKYHIVSHCPTPWRDELSQFLAQRPSGRDTLFRSTLGTSSEVIDQLRTANPSLNCRSVRRGSLQTLATDPEVSEETMKRLSGHRTTAMLHRYLNWDAINAQAHQSAQNAAKGLTRQLEEERSASPRQE